MSTKYFSFRPNLHGPFAKRFYTHIKQLKKYEDVNGEVESIIKSEVDWALNRCIVNPLQRRIYRATWLLFRDLLRVGWVPYWNSGTLELAPPSKKPVSDTQEIQREKEKIRRAMSAARLERIAEAKDFIQRVEGTSSSRVKVPITALIADGRSLSKDLSAIAKLPNEEAKLAALRVKIQPYLQLVREDTRCSETGHKISDIWRYFRFTWSTPADSTPGRTMLYLVRDAARPYHPVMGLASLENSPLVIADRDTHLGWTSKAFQTEVNEGLKNATDDSPIKIGLSRLLGYIANAIEDINLEGLCTIKECEKPTERLLLKLAGVVARSTAEREEALRAWHSRHENEDEDAMPERSEMGSSSKDAVEALFRRKRAEQLGRLLTARLHLQVLLKSGNLINEWKQYVEDKDKRSVSASMLDTAIRTALQALKNRHVGTSMLELNVCGAIPPYNEILAGKLVALLMLSPEVVNDYRGRYGERPSDIASKMKGKDVIRPAELIYIGTTSLYHVGASQYNRLKLPAGLLRQSAPEVRWRDLGETSGYGTLHISRLTAQCLEEAAGGSYVHHIFGEGASPKLRQFRHGMEAVLGVSSSTKSAFSKHEMSRLVYGVWLATNGPAIFRGEQENPDYYFDASTPAEEATAQIADYWRRRWLLGRISNPDIWARLSSFDPEILRISNELIDARELEFEPIPLEVPDMPKPSNGSKKSKWRDFVRDLYLGTSAYADNIDPGLLEAMHVKTSLDDAIIKAVKAGKSVVLTGNPGDGKTHLLRVLAKRLEGLRNNPAVELDASTLSNSQIKAKWERAKREGRPFCIAINEAILKSLADEFPKFALAQEAQQQVEQAVVYSEEAKLDHSVIVFDLSRRNVLSKDIVTAALDKLTNPTTLNPCERCPAEGCDLIRNQSLLRTQRFRDRLQVLFDQASIGGYHVTLRELQNLISYMLFGGRSCDRLLRESGDHSFALNQLPYTGVGRLFDILRDHFDPVSITHPIWDEYLVSAEIDPEQWLPEWHAEDDTLDPGDIDRFKFRKRAFYYFHAQGDELLKMAGNDEGDFMKFLNLQERDALRLLIRRINNLFGIAGKSEDLRVWQSHRYNQSPRHILYSSQIRPRHDFELVHPKLRSSMAEAFDMASDHVLLRLKSRPEINLRIDFALFHTLRQAERGVPVLSLEGDTVRRLWQFIEQLAEPPKDQPDEITVVLLDLESAEQMNVTIDPHTKRYLSITRRGGSDAYSD